MQLLIKRELFKCLHKNCFRTETSEITVFLMQTESTVFVFITLLAICFTGILLTRHLFTCLLI